MSTRDTNNLDELCGCGRPARYVRLIGDERVHSCNKYGRCPTYDELREASRKQAILISAYRQKREVDGLNGRAWDASKHFAAEARIEALEAETE